MEMISDAKAVRTTELRRSNRRSVFLEIYRNRSVSKEQIKLALGLSLPTVTQNLQEMEEQGLIRKQGLLSSTGGRKANAYAVVNDFRVAIGLYLQKEAYSIEAIDLYGEVLARKSVNRAFARTDAYFRRLGESLERFFQEHTIDPASVLGVGAALEAIVSPDHQKVTYSEVYKCTGLRAEELGKYISFPVTLYHDSHATAEAELWARNDIKNAVLIILNRYMGGALIIDGSIREGASFGCVLEHMQLQEDGPRCYCGKNGCFETFCSTYALERDAGESLDGFFAKLRSGNEKAAALWERYLQYLSQGINNIRMLIDCEFIIGGHLGQYLSEEDFARLRAMADEKCPLKLGSAVISPSEFRSESAAKGAALPAVKTFLQGI